MGLKEFLSNAKTFGEESGLRELATIGRDAAMETDQPGYMDRKRKDELNKKNIESLIKSREFQNILQKARAVALQNRQEGPNPLVKSVENLGKIQNARDKFTTVDKDNKVISGMTDETAAFFDAAETSEKRRMQSYIKADIRADMQSPKAQRSLAKREDYVSPDYRGMFTDGVNPFDDTKPTTPKAPVSKIAPADEQVKDISEYLQGSTSTVPEENKPKTFEELGIETPGAQATLQEMQNILPDVDMRQEYEDDPEGMRRLMELWRKGKLNKKNLRKAFSALQQKAQQSLGIA